jgi:hypothetical protein
MVKIEDAVTAAFENLELVIEALDKAGRLQIDEVIVAIGTVLRPFPRPKPDRPVSRYPAFQY